jgi:hypothetical protein
MAFFEMLAGVVEDVPATLLKVSPQAVRPVHTASAVIVFKLLWFNRLLIAQRLNSFR